MPDNPSDLLPLTPRVFLLMWALNGEAQHGYRLLSRLEELGRGHVSIGPASLYESIHTLRRRGLIEQAEPPQGADRRRRYFQLTDQGRSILESEAGRLARLVADLRADGLVDGVEAR